MRRLKALKRQHKDILVIAKTIDEKIKNKENENNLEKNIARLLNELAGKLKFHLSNEDKFLYPKLKNSEVKSLSQKAISYEKEMGGLVNEFSNFHKKYNTPSKLKEKINEFEKSFLTIKALVKARIDKEEKDLYIEAKKI